MKKTLLFLSCLLTLLTGCSQNEMDQDHASGGTNTQSSKIRWYGSKLVEEPQTRGVADGAKRWNQDAGVYVKFINTPSDPQIINKIKQTAVEWEEYAGIKFHFVEQDKKADVRIAFDWNNNDWLTWSYTGNDAKSVTDQNQPTAVFGGIQYLDDTEFKGDVLRLFGQILGLEYEQRHQQWSQNGYWKDVSQLQTYWEDQFDGYNMDWNQIRQYVFEPITEGSANQLLETQNIDEQSVMAWPYYNRRQTTKLLANYELSEGDKTFIARLYPKTATTLPTIQEAWVDTGYFVWTDSTKTALRMTLLGIEQEYLPDVSDGEQLTSANRMFRCEKSYLHPKLKKVPKFNTSNITDFGDMFINCSSLTSITSLDTSKGTVFARMFGGCSSLTSIPFLDTSKGTTFIYMFEACLSLTSIPTLNTSAAIGNAFGGMFHSCHSLTTIPFLDTSNATGFMTMFSGCKSLTSIPPLDTSKGIYFSGMFTGCKSLVSIRLLDTSKGTDFSHMFQECNSMTSIPGLNTSKGINFGGMFINCRSLTSKPELDLSNATNVHNMYGGTPFG